MFLEGLAWDVIFVLMLFVCVCKLYWDARLDDWNVEDDDGGQKPSNT